MLLKKQLKICVRIENFKLESKLNFLPFVTFFSPGIELKDTDFATGPLVVFFNMLDRLGLESLKAVQLALPVPLISS